MWSATALMLGLIWVMAANDALADEVNLLQQRAQISVGTFLNASSLEVRLDGEAGETGTTVDWGDTFGDEDKNRIRVDALWRVANRHYLRLMYTDYSRSNTRVIEDEIVWGGDVIPVGATATGQFAFEILEAAYEYAFRKSENFELTGSLGLHYTTLEASLRSEVNLGGQQGTVELGDRASTSAPLPVVGARTLWRFNENFYLEVLGQAFYLSFDDFDGTILNGRAAVTWQPKALIGLGVGYDWFRVDFDLDRPNFSGSMDWTYRGPQVFFTVSF